MDYTGRLLIAFLLMGIAAMVARMCVTVRREGGISISTLIGIMLAGGVVYCLGGVQWALAAVMGICVLTIATMLANLRDPEVLSPEEWRYGD